MLLRLLGPGLVTGAADDDPSGIATYSRASRLAFGSWCVLNVSTEQETDFWRETHYGFNRDNGHFFNCETNGDFTAELRVQAQYDELYDQAGIMERIRVDRQ